MGIPLRVLIIEDAEDDTVLLLRLLRQGGYEPISERVETSEGLNTALDSGGWDVILSDCAMPKFRAPAALKLALESPFEEVFQNSVGKP